MDLLQLGLDHHTASLAVREHAAVSADHLPALLAGLRQEPWVAEALVVSTCNRTEAYVVSADPDAPALLPRALHRLLPDAPDEASGVWVRRVGEDAARHLFRVATGLESAILGETEVQGQVKEALRAALDARAAGPVLDRLASLALRAGKRVRTETPLCRGAVSHGQAAFEVTRQIFGGLKHRTVLVVGAGEMATRAATALAALPGGIFLVANRTRETAEHLASTLPEAKVLSLEEVPARLSEAHVAVFAGAGDGLTKAHAQAAAARRRDPLLLLDYGVPRCVDPSVVDIPGVFLYDLEAIEALLAKSLAGRREAVPAAEALLDEEFSAFLAWHRTLEAVPAIRSLHAWADEIRRVELERLPADTPQALREAVESLTHRIVERILRRPAARVRQGVEERDPALPTPDHLRNVFGLFDEASPAEKPTGLVPSPPAKAPSRPTRDTPS